MARKKHLFPEKETSGKILTNCCNIMVNKNSRTSNVIENIENLRIFSNKSAKFENIFSLILKITGDFAVKNRL